MFSGCIAEAELDEATEDNSKQVEALEARLDLLEAGGSTSNDNGNITKSFYIPTEDCVQSEASQHRVRCHFPVSPKKYTKIWCSEHIEGYPRLDGLYFEEKNHYIIHKSSQGVLCIYY